MLQLLLLVGLFGLLEGLLVGFADRRLGDRYPLVREFRRSHAFVGASLSLTSFALLLAFACYRVVAFGL
jgi:hypothetical protein